MRSLTSTILMALTLITSQAQASLTEPKNGVEFDTLSTPQPVADAGKVEVLEIFGYFCPHCAAWDAELQQWAKQQGKTINFRRLVVYKKPEVTEFQQRMYLSLQAIGKLDELHPKIFAAIQGQHLRLESEDAIINYVVSQGVDRNRFVEQFNSFSIQTTARKLTQSLPNYQSNTVPTIVIDGRFVTSPTTAIRGTPAIKDEPGSQRAALTVMTELVKRAQASKH